MPKPVGNHWHGAKNTITPKNGHLFLPLTRDSVTKGNFGRPQGRGKTGGPFCRPLAGKDKIMGAAFGFLSFIALILMIVGLVKPAWFKLTRKKVFYLFGGAFVVLFAIGISVTNSTPAKTTNNTAQQPAVAQTTNAAAEVASSSTPAITSTPASTAKTSTKSAAAKSGGTAIATKPQPTPVAVQPTPPPSTPPSTPAPQTDNQHTSPTSNETVSQQNAVAKAKDYLNYTAFSHDGLVAQLEYDQFSQADATYGADNSGANWDAEAAAKAKDYMSYSAFSRGSLIEQLEYDKFTQEQAEYGANSVGL